MDLFAELEHLISSQSPYGVSPADVLAEVGSPSVSIAILDHGSLTSKCISTVGGDTETLFQACSISKPITGMAIMRLVQAGRLQLDAKIVDLLPDHVISLLATPHTRDMLKLITVRHLMSHTSGLSVYEYPGYSRSDEVPDLATILSGKGPASTLQVRLIGLPGYKMSYSGGGMIVLQIVLETVTGKDYPALVKELVFEPLGMSRSFFSIPNSEANFAKAHLTGYTPCDAPFHNFPESAVAGLWTTPTDLLKAVRGMQRSLKNRVGEGQVFLEQTIAREMLEEVDDTMALSWIARKDPGNSFGHGGSNSPGWRCFVLGYVLDLQEGKDGKIKYDEEGLLEGKLRDECGISVMTNSAEGSTVWAKLFHAINYLKKWAPIPDVTGMSVFGKIPFCAYGAEINEGWIEWKGSWYENIELDKKLLLEESDGGKPVLRFGNNVEAKLVPAAMPTLLYEGKGRSIDLVLEGFEMMIRLGWKDPKNAVDERIIELWFDGMPPRQMQLVRKE